GNEARNLCLSQTGSAPRRPHMIFFNPANSHAIVSFVATGHVLFMDAATRIPLQCIDVGDQAHAAVPSPDQTYVVVANQNGKQLQRIKTNYQTNQFTLDNAATLGLANCTTPSGTGCQHSGLRPDNAPICPIVDSSSRYSFVTLRGGGLFVVDSTATPMAIVAEYDKEYVHPNGCGGIEASGKVYINSGGGTTNNPLESDLYALPLNNFSIRPNPPNQPIPKLIFSHDSRGFVDSHGMALTKSKRYLWVVDRAANRIVIVDVQKDYVVNEINLVNGFSPDPAPDLINFSSSGNRAFIALRGLKPLTSNDPTVNNAVGSTPGVGVVRVEQDGRSGVLEAIAPISPYAIADPHGITVRPLN
ncbi:MAG TPA: hypothetical protein V6D48_11850, partial [Oculatellaceae cyanobacterium]